MQRLWTHAAVYAARVGGDQRLGRAVGGCGEAHAMLEVQRSALYGRGDGADEAARIEGCQDIKQEENMSNLQIFQRRYRRDPPRYDARVLPENERRIAILFDGHLWTLNRHLDAYATALDIIAMARTNFYPSDSDRLADWCKVARRDSIMSVYHFGCVLEESFQFEDCKQLRLLVAGPLKSARKIFKSDFPTWRSARDVVAHITETTESGAMQEKHSAPSAQISGLFDMRGGSTTIVEAFQLMKGTYINTWKKKTISVQVDLTTFEKLMNVRNAVFDAFALLEGTPFYQAPV